MRATLTSKGQLTLPVQIRRKLHLNPGDRIEFTLTASGRLEGVPVRKNVSELKGILPAPERKVSLSDMRKAVEEGASGDRD